jgi:radical SAM protein with 4Fe4S-binding SPASM domain
MKTQDRFEYVDRFEGKMLLHGRPIYGQLDVTYRCNISCRHCFIARDENKKELTLGEIKRILDDIQRIGCLWLCLSGGEPFAREDFPDIYEYAHRKGFLITLFTNGTLITERVADFLARRKPNVIEITLNGISPDIYEAVTGSRESLPKVLEGIGHLKERGLPLRLKCNGMTINRDEILKIKRFADETLGKGCFRCDPVLYPGIDGSPGPLEIRLSPEEVVALELSDDDMRSFCRDRYQQEEIPSRILKKRLFVCNLSGFEIDPYGRLWLCSFLRDAFVDLRKEDLLEGFRGLRARLLGLTFGTASACRDCVMRHVCRNCPGRAMAETGDPESVVTYYCELSRRKEAAKELVLQETAGCR